MAAHLTDEQKQLILDLHAAKMMQKDIAANIGVSGSTVCNFLKRHAIEGHLGFAPVLPGFEITKISTKTDDGYITQRPMQPEVELVMPDGHILEKASLKIGDSWYKTKLSAGLQTKSDILEAFAEYRGKAEITRHYTPRNDDKLLTVYPTSDLHVGMLAWGRETGEKWDLKIACDTILHSMQELIDSAPFSSTGVLIDLGDYTHNNDQSNETPAHRHQLDVDGRFPKIGKEAMKLRVQLIHMALEKHEHVIYRGLPGNHDPEVAQMIAIAMGLLFENEPRVTVDDDPSDFWFYEHGTVMLAANHGHRTRPEKLPGVMASYRPEMWGRTKVRQAWSGHIHHTKAGEDMGARWETLRTAAPRDAYSHQHGYCSGRELTAWTYHSERGFRSKIGVEIL
jgi:hypothetical protein